MADGTYEHPAPQSLEAEMPEGVLLIKPGMSFGTTALADLALRVMECGYRIRRARCVTGQTIDRHGLAVGHYLPHSALASRGKLTVSDYVRLLDIYDTAAFRGRFGVPATDVDVQPVELFMRRHGVPRRYIIQWSEASAERHGLNSGALDGPNEVGDYTFVNVFRHTRFAGGRPVFVINPHMPGVLKQYRDRRGHCYVFHLEAFSSGAISWRAMRRDFCGTSDPQKASPGSLRGDALHGWFDVRPKQGGTITRSNNGIHLSNGAVEAVRELSLWFDLDPHQTQTGAALQRRGLSCDAVCNRPFLLVGGQRRVVAELTNGADADEAARLLRYGRLTSSATSGSMTLAQASRVRAARRAAQTLNRAGVLAVVASGSVARGRATPSADIDLVVILKSPRAQRRVTVQAQDGCSVEIDWMTTPYLESLLRAKSPSIQTLREAGRAALGVPLLGDSELVAGYADEAKAMRLPRAHVQSVVAELQKACMVLPGIGDSATAWAVCRSVLDEAAVLTLSMDPIRYQKPKWTMDDLRAVGANSLRRLLLRSYGATGVTGRRSADTLRRTDALIQSVGRLAGYPPKSEVIQRAHRIEVAGFGYCYRTLADAEELNGLRRHAEAMYVGKMAATLGLVIAEMPDHGASRRVRKRELEQLHAEYSDIMRIGVPSRMSDRDIRGCRRAVWRLDKSCRDLYDEE